MICRYRYHGRVRRVVDGDTVRVDLDLGLGVWRHSVALRLLGIDAPELRGPERRQGLAAKQWLTRLIGDKEVVVETHRDAQGKYGRWMATIWLDDANVNERLIAEGHARRTA